MRCLFRLVLYGAYLFWKHTFYGVRNEINDKEVSFNIVCATAMLSIVTCLDFILLYVLLFKKNKYTSCVLTGYETVGTIIVYFIPLLLFLFLFLKKRKYIDVIRSLENEKNKKSLSLIFWIIYMTIPIIALIFIS